MVTFILFKEHWQENHTKTMEWGKKSSKSSFFVAKNIQEPPGGCSTKELSVEKIFCIGRSQAACIQVKYPSYTCFRSVFANHIS